MRLTLATLIAGLVVASEVSAAWTICHVRPDMKRLENGLVRVTAVRERPENDAELYRSSRLTVADSDGVVSESTVMPSTEEPGKLIYQFTIRESALKYSKLEVFEKKRANLKVLGGGYIFEYSTHPLDDFLIDVRQSE